MNKKEDKSLKLKNLIIDKATESLGLGVQTKKSKETKASKKDEGKKETEKPKKVKAIEKELPKAKKEKKTIEKAKEMNKVDLVESVISNREVKYIYPDNCIDTLSRKKWRQSVRNKLRTLERDYLRIKDQKSPEYKKAMEAYKTYQASVLKLDVAV